MTVIKSFVDGFKNLAANLGTPRDKAAHSSYALSVFPPNDLLTIYRESWLAGALVDYPADDCTRKWRAWRAKKDQITKIERLEDKLDVKRKVRDALVSSRLYGGAAIYINTAPRDPMKPLRPGEEVKSLVVVGSSSLTAGEIEKDISLENFGKPKFYTMTSNGRGSRVDIHPSRFVIFTGRDLPDAANLGINASLWGDSVIQSAYQTIVQADGTMANIASLVYEAKINVFKFDGLADTLREGAAGESAITSRMVFQAMTKGNNGDVVLDGKDDFLSRTMSFSGLDAIAKLFDNNTSGAFKIPLTRLFGRAAVGLSGSGDGDERVYYDGIGQAQNNDIGPALNLLDDCLIYQALGSRPEEVHYQWRPLRQLTEVERADIFVKTATAARTLAGTTVGEIIPLDALSEAVGNELIEQGALPGLEQSLKKFGGLGEQNLPPDDGEEE